MIQVCVFTLFNNECPLRDIYDEERLQEYEDRRAAQLSVISDSRYSPWLDVVDIASNHSRKNPDSDSLLTMTTASDVYMDERLSVDLNEKIYLRVSQT